MGWPSMESKILPATLDLPTSTGVCSEGYSGLPYSAPKCGPEVLKSTWEAIPTTPLAIAWHVRGRTAFLCADMDPRLFKKHLKGDECYTHSLPIVWVKYDFSTQQVTKHLKRPQREAKKAARTQAPTGSPLHSAAQRRSPRGVVRVRGGGGEADTLLHAAEEEVLGAGVSGGE